MGKFLVEGQQRLEGRIRVNGAKNLALKLMVATLLGEGTFQLENVPEIADVRTMMGVLEVLGVGIDFSSHRMQLQVSSLQGVTPQDLAKSMRASVQVMGPLVAKLGWAEVARPGGCAIGTRPLDIHLSGLEKMGATIDVQGDRFVARASRLRGADMTLRYPSVGATENIMMAATLAKGTTVIRNAAREPEIVDIQDFVNAMGAKVRGAGTSVITIEGGKELGSADYVVTSDRIEAGTYLLAFLISGGSGIVENVIPQHLQSLFDVLRSMGAVVEVKGDSVHVASTGKLRPFRITTSPYPGFPTDLQPQMVAVATQAQGRSELVEAVFDARFGYTEELKKLGARIELDGETVIVDGESKLAGSSLLAGDLRGGAALLLAALAAEGESIVSGAHHIDRGYESIEERLSQLGAKISRIEE